MLMAEINTRCPTVSIRAFPHEFMLPLRTCPAHVLLHGQLSTVALFNYPVCTGPGTSREKGTSRQRLRRHNCLSCNSTNSYCYRCLSLAYLSCQLQQYARSLTSGTHSSPPNTHPSVLPVFLRTIQTSSNPANPLLLTANDSPSSVNLL